MVGRARRHYLRAGFLCCDQSVTSRAWVGRADARRLARGVRDLHRFRNLDDTFHRNARLVAWNFERLQDQIDVLVAVLGDPADRRWACGVDAPGLAYWSVAGWRDRRGRHRGDALYEPNKPVETSLRHRDGTMLPVELILKSLDFAGRPHQVIAVRDLRAR